MGIASAVAVTDREIRPFAMILGWLATGLVGELVQAIRVLRERPEPVHRDPTPADGRVALAKVEGAKRHLNPGDLRFGRFLAWDEPDAVHRGAAAGSRGFPPLLGRVVVASFFLGRDGRRWDDDEIAIAHKAMIRAGEWIEAQAIRWGAAVNVELADTYVVADDPAVREEVEIAFVKEGDETVPDEVDAAVKGLAATGRAAATLGFRDAVDLAGALAHVASRPTPSSGSSTAPRPADRGPSPARIPAWPASTWRSAMPTRTTSPARWTGPSSPTRSRSSTSFCTSSAPRTSTASRSTSSRRARSPSGT